MYKGKDLEKVFKNDGPLRVYLEKLGLEEKKPDYSIWWEIKKLHGELMAMDNSTHRVDYDKKMKCLHELEELCLEAIEKENNISNLSEIHRYAVGRAYYPCRLKWQELFLKKVENAKTMKEFKNIYNDIYYRDYDTEDIIEKYLLKWKTLCLEELKKTKTIQRAIRGYIYSPEGSQVKQAFLDKWRELLQKYLEEVDTFSKARRGYYYSFSGDSEFQKAFLLKMIELY